MLALVVAMLMTPMYRSEPAAAGAAPRPDHQHRDVLSPLTASSEVLRSEMEIINRAGRRCVIDKLDLTGDLEFNPLRHFWSALNPANWGKPDLSDDEKQAAGAREYRRSAQEKIVGYQ